MTHGNGKAGGHAVKIVRMLAHSHHLRNNRLLRPIDAKDLCELLEILSGRLTNGKNGVTEPAHAEITQLLIEKFDTKLASKKGNVFDDSETHSPLLVLGQLDNCGKERLRKKVDAND